MSFASPPVRVALRVLLAAAGACVFLASCNPAAGAALPPPAHEAARATTLGREWAAASLAVATALKPLEAAHLSMAVSRPNGALVYGHLPVTPRTPASVLKLVTVGAVLDALGPDYRFPTELYRHGAELLIKGYGDPFLISEEWQALIAGLPEDLLFDELVLDDSYFAEDLGVVQEPDVANPYNARNAAFATNFNTVAFTVSPRGRITPEPQTPWVDFVSVRVVRSSSKESQLSVHADEEGVRITVAKHPRTGHKVRVHLGFHREALSLYAGHLFVALGQRAGRPWGPRRVRRGRLNKPDSEPWHTHLNSRTVEDMCKGLLKYSNNFIANQLLLAAGAQRAGAPATLQKAVDLLRAHARKANMAAFAAYEASGLDPRDRVTAEGMVRYLWWAAARFPDYVKLLPQSHAGRVREKSGTFDDFGVRAVAGYVLDERGEPALAFAFLCDAPGKCHAGTAKAYERALEQLAAATNTRR